ncbi:MAG: ribosome maturation factor RimP [Blastocatellia bacterium]|nr:ribosome maturation factor RimP [Blastocatellia bacterium]
MESVEFTGRIREIADEVVAGAEEEIVHVEVIGSKRSPIVRIFIDKPGGVTVDDCSRVSSKIEAVMDAEDTIPMAYTLEVSSPGIERGLYSIADFERFAGQKAKVKLNGPINGQRNFSGTIEAVEAGEIKFNDSISGSVSFPHSAVSKANLTVDFDEELKKGQPIGSKDNT